MSRNAWPTKEPDDTPQFDAPTVFRASARMPACRESFSRSGAVQIMRAAQPLTDMMSFDGYSEVVEIWDYMPGEDGCPFEPKACDWGWFEGRMVALDYSTPAWSADEASSS